MGKSKKDTVGDFGSEYQLRRSKYGNLFFINYAG